MRKFQEEIKASHLEDYFSYDDSFIVEEVKTANFIEYKTLISDYAGEIDEYTSRNGEKYYQLIYNVAGFKWYRDKDLAIRHLKELSERLKALEALYE